MAAVKGLFCLLFVLLAIKYKGAAGQGPTTREATTCDADPENESGTTCQPVFEESGTTCESRLDDDGTTCEAPLTDEPTKPPGATSPPNNVTVCSWAAWSSWSDCDCRSGFRHRKRAPRVHPRCSVDNGCSRLVKPCRRFPCPVDCIYTQWSSWSRCEGGCEDGGSRWRSRYIHVPQLFGGRKCKTRDLYDSESCVLTNLVCRG